MPKYEYECQAWRCQYRFEIIQKMDDEPVATCPECGEEAKRIITAASSHFVGGRPSKERAHQVGKHKIPVQQTEDGQWQQRGIMDQR